MALTTTIVDKPINKVLSCIRKHFLINSVYKLAD